MHRRTFSPALTVLAGLLLATVCLQVGCVGGAANYVPANRLPPEFLAETRSDKTTINLTFLTQPPPPAYILGTGDTLAIIIPGILPPPAPAGVNAAAASSTPLPVISQSFNYGNAYYPPKGYVATPALGVPMQVQGGGRLPLPLVDAVHVDGMTLDQAAEAIRKVYLDKGLLKKESSGIDLTLIRPRIHRVMVIREDSNIDMPQQLQKGNVVFTKKGRADLVDLPAFENDVLHALGATGGLPGIDAVNEVWVLRNRRTPGEGFQVKWQLEAGADPRKVFEDLKSTMPPIRIPLRQCECEFPVAQEDVILYDGDIVFIPPREQDYFYTGGLLAGGQIPLPRDHDLDVLEAVTLATGSIGGPGGAGGATAVLRAGAGPGNVIPPTRVLIVRKLADGQTLPIRVDLVEALRNPRERVLILPGDLVMLQYKPGEKAGNIALNFFNWNISGILTAN